MRSARLWLALALYMSISVAMAQCEKKTDDMTGKVTIVSQPEAITGVGARGTHGKLPLKVYTTIDNDTTILYLRMSVRGDYTYEAGTLIYLEMGTDSLELRTTEKSSADRGDSGLFGPRPDKDNRSWFTIMKFALKPAEIAKLKANKITAISVDKQDYDVSASHQSVIADMLRCLDQKRLH